MLKLSGLKQHLLSHSCCGSEIQEQFSWVVWLRVCHEITIKVLARAAGIQWLDWGQRILSLIHSLLAVGWRPEASFPRASDLRENKQPAC